MSILSFIGLVGGVCSLAGYIPYARSVIKGKQAPERASWLIWTLSSTLILLSYWELGARSTIWVPVAYVIGSLFITVLAFVYGRHGWGRLDQLALIVAVISSIRWVYFDDPAVALILNMVIGFIGYLPHIWKLAKDPLHREDLDLEGWTLFTIGAFFNIFAVSSWTFVIAAVPIFMLVMNGATLALSIRNSIAREKAPPLLL